MVSFLKNLKDMYSKYRVVVCLALSTIFFIFSTFWSSVTAFNVAFLTIIFMSSPVNEIIYYLVYFMMFSRSTVFFVLIAVTALLCIIVKFVSSVVKREMTLSKLPLIVTTSIVIVFSLINYSLKFEGVCQGLLVIGLLYLGYMLFCYRDKIDVKTLLTVLFIGILSSAIVSLILYNIPKAEILYYDTDDFYLKSVKNLIFIRESNFSRLMLLSYHPNHLNSYCLFIMSYIVHQLINEKIANKKDLIVYFIAFSICFAVGLMTVSKAFLLCTVLIIGYGCLFLMIKHRKQSWKYIIPIVLIVLIIGLCFLKTILITLGRFFSGEFNDTIASTITTGRTDIWKQYFKEIFSSPWKILFGHGIFATDIVAIGAHNTYVSVLYRFGFLGVIALGGLLLTYYFECKNLHFSLFKFLPMVFLFVYALQEVIIDERFLFLVLAIMLLFEKNNDSINNNTDAEDDKQLKNITYNNKVKMKVSKKKQ